MAALASDVELLLLDEPTSGLDPLMDKVFRSCIVEERRRGRTVLLSSHVLSSHVLSEVEALCDRVSIIHAGRTVETGTLADLRHLTRTAVSAELATEPVGLERLAGVHDLVIDGVRVQCEVDAEDLDGLLRALTESGVRGLVSHPPTGAAVPAPLRGEDPAEHGERRGGEVTTVALRHRHAAPSRPSRRSSPRPRAVPRGWQ